MWRSLDGDVVTRLGHDFESELRDLAASGARFDTVLSVFRLVGAYDLDATVGRLRTVLADEGRLLFLEPVARGGAAARTAGAVAGLARIAPWQLDRDVPSILRGARLSITDLHRHRLPPYHWWLRQLVEGSAHHALAPDEGRAPTPR
jgi:hypothetical protein